MSLIEINPDLRRLTLAAERIAFTLERIALAAYGIAPAPPKRVWGNAAASEDDVGYATDTETLRQELEAAVMPGTVAERDGPEVEEELGNVLDPNRRA